MENWCTRLYTFSIPAILKLKLGTSGHLETLGVNIHLPKYFETTLYHCVFINFVTDSYIFI